ncbi:hypothetical protein JW935_21845 [candidate division KSB1 bacterium]|nr:hypothetical protein [candidate division KSB1 bacterium]
MYKKRMQYSALFVISLGLFISGYGICKWRLCGSIRKSNFVCKELDYQHISLDKTKRGQYEMVFILKSGEKIHLDEDIWKDTGDTDMLLDDLNRNRTVTIWTRTEKDNRILGLKTANVYVDPKHGINQLRKNNMCLFIVGLFFVLCGGFYFYHVVFK